MTTLHKQHTAPSVWSFNHRVRGYVSDSDSDSGCVPDVDADVVAKADTSDARLMREMDLSGRHETVEYRPNPWSIARINAASRPSLPKSALPRTPAPARSPPKPQPKPIVEAFKKQTKRGPREVQPIVCGTSNLEENSIGVAGVDKSCTVKRDGPSAKKSRQGYERNQNTALAQVRACPQPTQLLDPPSPAHKPQNGSTIRAVGALEKEKFAHISTFSNRFIRSGHAPTPITPRRIFGTHQVARSSPVSLVAPQNAPDAGRGVRDRPTFHHSSPGPRLHAPVSGKTRSNPDTCRPTEVSNDLPPVSRLPRDMGQGTPPRWPSDALDDGIYAPPPLSLVPEPRQEATHSPHIRTPESKHTRRASPGHTPPRKKPRASASRPPDPTPPTTSAPRRFPAAYAFGEDDDPDAEWSTLARTKRRTATSAKRVGKPGGVRQSGCFRLPLPGLAPRTPTRAPEAKRRVITYLLPPMASKKQVDEITTTIDQPPRGPAKHARVEAEEEQNEGEEIEICVMDSDVTLVNEDEEHVVGIDVDDVCVRYPTTRASMKAESRVRKAFGCIVELRI